MRLTQIIEALLFASDAPLSATDLSRVDERLDEDTVEAIIQELRGEYEQGERSFQIYEVAGGYQLLTRPEFVSVLERYDSVPQPSRLSAPALEVLAIIAYRQPLGRAEIEDIRGVGSSGVLRTLVERSLVEAVARGEGLGRPLLYGTTAKFLEHFGFRSLEDLPRPDELSVVLRERPAPQPEAETGASDDGAAAESASAAAPGMAEPASAVAPGTAEPEPAVAPGDAVEQAPAAADADAPGAVVAAQTGSDDVAPQQMGAFDDTTDTTDAADVGSAPDDDIAADDDGGAADRGEDARTA